MNDGLDNWKVALNRLSGQGISARVVSGGGPLIQVEGRLADGEPFFLHCRGERCWLGVGGDEPASAPYWHWMIRRRDAGLLPPDEAIAVFMELHHRYLADRKAALEADTTWWNLRHRPRLDDSLTSNTGGLALSWKGASQSAIEILQRKLQVRFPDDYVRFMRASDGAEGEVGSAWLQLWSLDKIEQQNPTMKGPPNQVVFGSDAEARGYAFKAGRTTEMVEIPFDSQVAKTAIPRGSTMVEFLRSLVAQPRVDA